MDGGSADMGIWCGFVGGYLATDKLYLLGEIRVGGDSVVMGIWCDFVGGYLATDKPYPRDEILVDGGHQCSYGY